jgi:hypothetical protein
VTREALAVLLAVLASYIGNPVSMLLAVHRKPAGWWIVAGTQALLGSFVFVATDWRFGGQVLCFGIACYGVWRWQIRREHEPAIGRAAGDIVINKPGLYQISTGGAVDSYVPSERWHELQRLHVESADKTNQRLTFTPPLAQPVTDKTLTTSATAGLFIVAQDALAALNHYDRQQAAELRERLEAIRAD